MPKIYKNRKKHIDPRYFLNERIEETVISPGEGAFPGVSNANRVKKLAQDAEQRQISKAAGETQPPWETQDECGAGFTDANLSEADYEVLEWILSDLQVDSGHGDIGAKHDRSEIAEHFAKVMEKLGVALGGHSPIDPSDHPGERKLSSEPNPDIAARRAAWTADQQASADRHQRVRRREDLRRARLNRV